MKSTERSMTEIIPMNYCDAKKVVLTGATGLIGKEAVQPLIDSGFKIYAISSKDMEANPDICWLKGDLFSRKDIERIFQKIQPNYLLHFAWAATGDYLTSDINIDYLNASLEMLKTFHKHGGKRAVFAGTCFEYAFKSGPLKESDMLEPVTIYAKCKNELRERAQEYCSNNDMSFGWGRIFYVFGRNENEKRLTAYIVDSLKNGKRIVINHGQLIRDYIYTKDVAGAFVKFLDANVSGCVNICTGKTVFLGDYANKIAGKLGKMELLTVLNGLTDQPPVIAGDNSRLTGDVGYEIKYTLDRALDDIIKGS